MPSTNYSYKNCTEVTPACPVEATFYGYLPSVPGNAAFAFIFAVCFFLQLWFGIRYKTKSYAIAVVLGCFVECVGKKTPQYSLQLHGLTTGCEGYISRLMLHRNPWKRVPLSIQIVTLVIAPVSPAKINSTAGQAHIKPRPSSRRGYTLHSNTSSWPSLPLTLASPQDSTPGSSYPAISSPS